MPLRMARRLKVQGRVKRDTSNREEVRKGSDRKQLGIVKGVNQMVIHTGGVVGTESGKYSKVRRVLSK